MAKKKEAKEVRVQKVTPFAVCDRVANVRRGDRSYQQRIRRRGHIPGIGPKERAERRAKGQSMVIENKA